MLKSLMHYKYFCLRNVGAALNLGQSEWESMEALLALLEPVYVATQMLQEEQLFYSDFFKIWLQMKLDVQTKPDSSEFLTILERREKVLLKNPTLLAALYLDPRLQCIIAKEPLQLMCARTHLKEVIVRILQLENQVSCKTYFINLFLKMSFICFSLCR